MPDQVIVRLNQIAAGDEVDDVDEEMVIPHLSEAEHQVINELTELAASGYIYKMNGGENI